ncbi:MAG: hypothetical protein LBC74_15930, partial [Planctomycetaceae bacterium]|nr:hypothetical protein [Planctomycetaceae bacterium]
NNSYSFESANKSKKVKVFFPPNVNVDGNTTFTASKPPCWFKFWKDGKVIDGIQDFNFDPTSTSHAYYDSSRNRLYLCSDAFNKKGQSLTLSYNLSYISDTSFGSGSLTVGSDEEYIDKVAALIAHEKYHKYCNDTFRDSLDIDGDGLPSNEEITPSKTYFKASSRFDADTFSIGTIYPHYKTYGDQEVRCRIEETENKPVVHKDKDWAADKRNKLWEP